MQRNPFKFLDSFTKEDREIFFGRDREIEELHTRVFESKILLVYGTSGTGKSSLINCGLANRFNDSDWLPVNIRRGIDINRSLLEALAKTAVTKAPFSKAGVSQNTGYNLEKLLRSVWLDHFKPIFLIFDQFEELFIFGSREEKHELIKNVAKVLDSDIQCRFIFSIREEYLAGVTEFEREIPSFLANRIRIEKMTRQNAIQTIEGPCRINNIEVEGGFAEALLQKLNPDKPEVELTWLQIYLDRIMRIAGSGDNNVKKLTGDLLDKAGEVKDILGTFLEEQISQLDDPDTGMTVLKTFVSVKGTRQQISENEVVEYSGTFGKNIDSATIKALIQRFIKLRILRDKDENGRYELRHDSLASKIFEDITLVEKELLEIKTFIDNAYSSFERRGQLLSDQDLKYIAPYEDKLYLNEKNQRFLDESKQAIHRVRRRRLNFAIAAAAALIIVLSFFSIWALTERSKAREKQKFAEQKMEEANLANEEARAASLRAQRGEETARIEGERAKEQQKLAEKRTAEAEWERANAARSEKQALEEKNRAEMNESIAVNAKHEADTQRIKAQNAEKEANRLSLLSTAQNLALISMTLEKKPEIMGLLAVQAFNFNSRNGGPIDDPVIYKALEKAFTVLDNSKHSVLKGAVSEVRCFSEKKDGFLGADMDGNLMKWTYDGNTASVEQPVPLSYISHISLNRGNNTMIIAYENKQLVLREQIRSGQQDRQLKGHSGTVLSSAWSSTGDYLATGGTDSLICIWETASASSEPVKKLKGSSAVRNLEFCNEDSLFSIHEDGSVFIWNLRSSTGRLLYSGSKEKALCLTWDRSRKNLLSGTSAGAIMIFNIGQGTVDTVRYSSHAAGIDHIIFNENFSLLATSSWDKSIRIYNFDEFFTRRNFIRGVIDIDDLESRSRVLMFTSDNKLVSAMGDKTIRIWETDPRKLVTMITSMVDRDLTEAEWSGYIGTEIPYEKTSGNKQP